MKDGKLNGTRLEYYEGGALREKTEYKNDLKHGRADGYFPNGNLQFEGNFEHDRRTGVFRRYYENGMLAEEHESYVGGDLEGIHRTFYPNGAPRSFFNYREGKQNGPAFSFDERGVMRRESYFLNDRFTGYRQLYKANGQPLYLEYWQDGVLLYWEFFWPLQFSMVKLNFLSFFNFAAKITGHELPYAPPTFPLYEYAA